MHMLQHIPYSDFNFILTLNLAIIKYDETLLNITINYVFQMAVKYLQIYLFFPHYYINIYMVVSRSKCICQSFLLSTSQNRETGRKESRCTFQNHVNGFSYH